jgi:TetR/AcrR family transcriptional repressor of mexJK operon
MDQQTHPAVSEPPDKPPGGLTQSALKREAITEAATRLFLDQGFGGTSMNQIAAAASVSKQTVYKQFTDKQQLLSDIVLGITRRAGEITTTMQSMFDEIVDLEPGLNALARRYASAVLHPEVLRLRRLVVCEAVRFPDLAQAYYEHAPKRGLEAVATGLGQLAERELLRIEDVSAAASHFAYLILGPLIDKAMFLPEAIISDAEISYWAAAGVATFINAYGTAPAE